MAKPVDMKKQQRVTLDKMLESIAHNGIIHLASLKGKWKSLKGIINPKRLIHFLETTGTKLSQKSFNFLYSVRKDLSIKVQQNPDLITT